MFVSIFFVCVCACVCAVYDDFFKLIFYPPQGNIIFASLDYIFVLFYLFFHRCWVCVSFQGKSTDQTFSLSTNESAIRARHALNAMRKQSRNGLLCLCEFGLIQNSFESECSETWHSVSAACAYEYIQMAPYNLSPLLCYMYFFLSMSICFKETHPPTFQGVFK